MTTENGILYTSDVIDAEKEVRNSQDDLIEVIFGEGNNPLGQIQTVISKIKDLCDTDLDLEGENWRILRDAARSLRALTGQPELSHQEYLTWEKRVFLHAREAIVTKRRYLRTIANKVTQEVVED